MLAPWAPCFHAFLQVRKEERSAKNALLQKCLRFWKGPKIQTLEIQVCNLDRQLRLRRLCGANLRRKKLNSANSNRQACKKNHELEARPRTETKGVVVLASGPVEDLQGCQVLEEATHVLRDTCKQLVAAGYARDDLHRNLPKQEWRDAWCGKLDGYLRACEAAKLPEHLVTFRGGRMCNWERELLEQEWSTPRVFRFCHLTHFEYWSELKAWIEQHSDKLVAMDLQALEQEHDEKVKQLEESFDHMKDSKEAEIKAVKMDLTKAKSDAREVLKQARALRDLTRKVREQEAELVQTVLKERVLKAEAKSVADEDKFKREREKRYLSEEALKSCAAQRNMLQRKVDELAALSRSLA